MPAFGTFPLLARPIDAHGAGQESVIGLGPSLEHGSGAAAALLYMAVAQKTGTKMEPW